MATARLKQVVERQQHRSTVTLKAEDLEILRGTSASVLLAWFGSRLRSTAGGIGMEAEKKAEDEFTKSYQVEELDIFLSHSWHAPWYLKYFTLLFYFNARPAIATSLICAIFCCGVRFIEVDAFRSLSSYLDHSLTPECPCLVFGSLGMFLTLIYWQTFLKLLESTFGAPNVKSLFLDKVCIHQTDAEKKAKGIKSIGALLANSRMVLVAWDPSYFSRLWCTFELAAYKFARPDSEVVVLPVNIGGFISALVFTNFASQVTIAVMKSIPNLKPLTKNHLAIYMSVYFIVACVCVGFFRNYVQALKDMDGQLEFFSVEDAECFCCKVQHKLPESGICVPCDRKLVYASIRHWSSKFGEAQTDDNDGLTKFNNLIRGTFRQDIAQAFRGSRVPYHFVLLYSIWAGLYQLDHLVPQRLYHKEGEDAQTLERSLEVLHTIFLCYPMNIALFIRLCVLVFSNSLRLQAFWQKRLVDFFMACIACGQSYGMIMFSNYLLRGRDDVWIGILWMIFEAIIVFLLYRRRSPGQIEDTMVESLGKITDVFNRLPRMTLLNGRVSAFGRASAFNGSADVAMLPEQKTQDGVAEIELAEKAPPFFGSD